MQTTTSYDGLEGEIGGSGVGSSRGDLDTLDEPVWETVSRDLRAVGTKFAHVLFPHKSQHSLLRDWDLWGPLFLCVFISLSVTLYTPLSSFICLTLPSWKNVNEISSPLGISDFVQSWCGTSCKLGSRRLAS